MDGWMDVIGRGGEGVGVRVPEKRGVWFARSVWRGGGWAVGWKGLLFWGVGAGGRRGARNGETGERERSGGLCQGRLFVLFVPLEWGERGGVGRKGRLGWARGGCCGGERGGVGGVGM